MTDTFLDRILVTKREEVARHKSQQPLQALEERIKAQGAPLNFSGALWHEGVALIAEVKKASPSKGLLRADFDPVALAKSYAQHGAAAVSVLTDAHFQGALEHMEVVKKTLSTLGVPVLRKDFILDPYQLSEARAYGADAALLIVAMLDRGQLQDLLGVARGLWLQCLVEVHNEGELETALEAGAEVVGINNRDLRTFETDLVVTERLAPRVPKGKVIVSESGVSTRQDVLRLHKAGAHAVLVGEALVTATDPGRRLQELLGRIPEAAPAPAKGHRERQG